MNKGLLKLFITGHSKRSELAVKNLHEICSTITDTEYEIIIIDVLDEPQQAEDLTILATPTVVKESPSPSRRVFGDLSATQKVIEGLDLKFAHKMDI